MKLLLFISILTASALAIAAQEVPWTIQGIVEDHNGAVVVRANVTVFDISGKAVARTTTDDDGKYTVSIVKSLIEIQVKALGFCTSERGISRGQGRSLVKITNLMFVCSVEHGLTISPTGQADMYSEIKEPFTRGVLRNVNGLILFGKKIESRDGVTYSGFKLLDDADHRVVFIEGALQVRAKALFVNFDEGKLTFTGSVIAENGVETIMADTVVFDSNSLTFTVIRK